MEAVGRYGLSCDSMEPRCHIVSNIALAGGADAVQPDTALLAAQRVQFCSFSGFTNVFAEYGDVDVLGEPENQAVCLGQRCTAFEQQARAVRSEEHTSELQSLMRLSYAVFCLKKIQSPHNMSTYT